MTAERLSKLLSLGEGRSTALMAEYRPESAGRQVCALLNSGGGYAVFGIGEDREAIGLDPRFDIGAHERELRGRIVPKTPFSFEVHDIEGKRVVVIEVPAGKDLPYSFDGDIFVRIGASTKKADVETIRDMVVRSQSEPERWERRFSDARLDLDLDDDCLSRTVKDIKKAGRIDLRDGEDSLAALDDLALVKFGRLTNAGDLLFCKNTARRYPQVRVKAAKFSKTKADDSYPDLKYFEGPALQIVEEVMAFILRNTPTASSFPKDRLRREDHPLYPQEAIREGLVNAFVHRDYSDFSGGLSVSIYPGRIEIWNSGELPEGVTVERLEAGMVSVLRNPDIAQVFFLAEMMEKLGRGSLLIQAACKAQGLPPPKWSSEAGLGATLSLFAPEVTPEVTPEVHRLVSALRGEMPRRELQEKLGLKDPDHFREAYIEPSLASGFIEMTIPESPRSSQQKYRLTKRGKSLNASDKKENRNARS